MRGGLERILLVVLGLLPLLPLEFAARYWVARAGDPLDRAMAVMRPDSRLGWRQRENFTGRFYGVALETNAQGLRSARLPAPGEPGRRVLLLGPSSTFGWGVVEDSTYARRLERELNQGLKTPVAVINAGQIGYSSWQGLRLYREELSALKPDVVVLAYGVNDVDRYRFMGRNTRPDRLALAGERDVSVESLLSRSALLTRLRRGAGALRFRFSCDLPRAGLRVPPADYAENLEALLAEARRSGAQAVLLTSAFKYRRSAEEAARCDQEYALSAGLAAEGRCGEARAAFERARKLEPARLERDLRAYNELVRAAARREKAVLIDAEALLGPGQLLDPVHPNEEGHAILGRALARKMLNSAHAGR